MLHRNFIPFPILTTERLTLRQLADSDKNEIFELRSDPQVNRFLDRKPSKTPDDAIDFINKINAGITNNQQLYWAISILGTNTLVGTICLFNFLEERNQVEIGYELLPQYQGQGFMQESIAKVISYGIDTIGLKRIEAFTHKDNQSSGKLLNKFNFIKEDEHEEGDDIFQVFSLTIHN